MPPTPEDLASFERLRLSADSPLSVPKVPRLPDDVRKRFPTLEKWERDMEEWRTKLNVILRGGQGS